MSSFNQMISSVITLIESNKCDVFCRYHYQKGLVVLHSWTNPIWMKSRRWRRYQLTDRDLRKGVPSGQNEYRRVSYLSRSVMLKFGLVLGGFYVFLSLLIPVVLLVYPGVTKHLVFLNAGE